MKRSALLVISCVATLPALVLGVGFLFHTSYDGVVFGKYSGRYFGFLCLWFVVILPLVFVLALALFDTQRIGLPSGRTVLIRPLRKIVTVLVVGLMAYVVVDAYVGSLMARRTTTLRADVFHPYLQNVPNPAIRKLAINAAGFRGAEIEREKPAHTFRVFLVGGSAVLCGSLRPPHTHCGLLEQKLRAAYPTVRIEVQNAGGDWHSSQHSVMKLLFQIQDYDPDLVIAYHGINDLLRSLVPDDFAEGAYRGDYRHYLGPVTNLVRPGLTRRVLWRLYTGCWFSDFRFDAVPVRGPTGRGINGVTVMYFPKSRPVTIHEWRSLGAFERNLRDFVSIARGSGIRVLLATQPYLYRHDLDDAEKALIWFPQSHHRDGTRPSLPSMIDGMEQFNATTAGIAEDLGVDFVDLEQMVPKTLDYFYDDVHYTREGNKLVATAFFDLIVEHDIVTDALLAASGDRD